jgi:hypothetical protein
MSKLIKQNLNFEKSKELKGIQNNFKTRSGAWLWPIDQHPIPSSRQLFRETVPLTNFTLTENFWSAVSLKPR